MERIRKKQKTNRDECNECANENAIDRINRVWNMAKTNDDGCTTDGEEDTILDDALEKTKQIVYNEFNSIVRSGLEAFHKNDALKRELTQAKELSESRLREIQRLRVSEVDTRASLSVSAIYRVNRVNRMY